MRNTNLSAVAQPKPTTPLCDNQLKELVHDICGHYNDAISSALVLLMDEIKRSVADDDGRVEDIAIIVGDAAFHYTETREKAHKALASTMRGKLLQWRAS